MLRKSSSKVAIVLAPRTGTEPEGSSASSSILFTGKISIKKPLSKKNDKNKINSIQDHLFLRETTSGISGLIKILVEFITL